MMRKLERLAVQTMNLYDFEFVRSAASGLYPPSGCAVRAHSQVYAGRAESGEPEWRIRQWVQLTDPYCASTVYRSRARVNSDVPMTHVRAESDGSRQAVRILRS